MKALDYKLLRGLWKLRGQVIAVSLIIASGVGVLIMSLSSLQALEETAQAYYERYRFADIFAFTNRTPEALKRQIAALPGVRSVDTRINHLATLDIADFKEPVMAQLVSLPERHEPLLNRLVLLQGRFVTANAPDEVVLNEPFAKAHRLKPGDQLLATINGNKRALRIVGIALSPEFVYAIGPGALMPDDKRYGILWMGREALEASYDLDGAFNFVSLALIQGTDPQSVIPRLDDLLEPYGGSGAIARKNQLSNWFLMNELEQLRTFATFLPTIFLLVAAFLTNMVLARLITIERAEIGLLKSFGYSNWQIAMHYSKLVIGMSMVGIVLGWMVGTWLGRFNTQVYADLYHFPILIFRPDTRIYLLATIVSLVAALSGSLGAVAKAVRLPPAEAMQPPAPAQYGKGIGSKSRLIGMLDQSTRIILRQLIRRPGRAALTSLGVAFSVAVLVMAMQWKDSIEHMVNVYFFDGQHQHAVLLLGEPQPVRVVHDINHLPGVLASEPARWLGADFFKGVKTHRGAIQGIVPNAQLQLVHDVSGRNLKVPDYGLIIGTELAKKLEVGIGDTLSVEIRDGRKPIVELPVVDLVETYIDLPAFMHLSALNRLLLEAPLTDFISVLIDKSLQDEFYRELKKTPSVTAVMLRESAVNNFNDTMAETIYIFIGFFGAFSAALGFGVVYNSTRITLSERGRELASLRVLGFSRAAISYILLGEVAILILIALPLGCLIGWSLAWVIVETAFSNELFRLPLIIYPSSYGFAILVTLASAALSAAMVQRRLNHLDLIAVLKTRE